MDVVLPNAFADGIHKPNHVLGPGVAGRGNGQPLAKRRAVVPPRIGDLSILEARLGRERSAEEQRDGEDGASPGVGNAAFGALSANFCHDRFQLLVRSMCPRHCAPGRCQPVMAVTPLDQKNIN